MIVTLVIAALLVAYLWRLHRATAAGGEAAASDRSQLLTRGAEAVFMVAIARLAIPWGELTRWLWVLAVAALFAALAGAALRAGELPAADPGAKPLSRAFKRVGAPLYALAMLALSALLLAPLA